MTRFQSKICYPRVAGFCQKYEAFQRAGRVGAERLVNRSGCARPSGGRRAPAPLWASGETALRFRVFRPGSSLRSGAKTQNLRTLFASGRRCAGARRPPPGHAFRFAPGTSVTSFALYATRTRLFLGSNWIVVEDFKADLPKCLVHRFCQ